MIEHVTVGWPALREEVKAAEEQSSYTMTPSVRLCNALFSLEKGPHGILSLQSSGYNGYRFRI